MKKDYEAPRAEKMEFNYTETVTASNCASSQNVSDAQHELGNSYYKCSCTTYYAPGWGQNC